MKIRKIVKSKKGAVGIITALTLVFLIGVTGTSIDMSRSMIIKSKVSGALDAGSIAAGLAAGRGVDLRQNNNVNRIANRYYNENYQSGGYLLSSNPAPVFTANYANNTVTGVTNNIVVSQSFGELSGVPTGKQNDPFVVNATNKVTFASSSALDVSFVIDTSCSMQGEWGGTGEDRIRAARRILPGILQTIYENVDDARIHAVAFDYQITKINDNDLGWNRALTQELDQYRNKTTEFMIQKNSNHAWRGNGVNKLRPNPRNISPYVGNASSSGFLSENFNTKAQGQVQLVTRMKRLRAPFRGCRTVSYHGLREARRAFAASPRPAGSTSAKKVLILVYDGVPTMDQGMIKDIQDFNESKKPDRIIESCNYPPGTIKGGTTRGGGRAGGHSITGGTNVGGQRMTGQDLKKCLDSNDNKYEAQENHRWSKYRQALREHQQECNLVKASGIEMYSFYIGSDSLSVKPYRDAVLDIKFRGDKDEDTLTKRQRFDIGNPNKQRVREGAWNRAKNDNRNAYPLANTTVGQIVYGCTPDIRMPDGSIDKRVFTPQNPQEFKDQITDLVNRLTKTRLTQ